MEPLFPLDAYLEMEPQQAPVTDESYLARLTLVLNQNLDFHDQSSSYSSHNLHSFPAKFPPQLPRTFINALTAPGDLVMDPMSGSGTTMVEAWLADRRGLGFDIDPLALKISRVKTTSTDSSAALAEGLAVAERARYLVDHRPQQLASALSTFFDDRTQNFVDYWFARETQIELYALGQEIASTSSTRVKAMLELVLSSTIVAKSSGVSCAFDLAHTRPHRAKIVYGQHGDLLIGHDLIEQPTERQSLLTKKLRSPISEFIKKLGSVVSSLELLPQKMIEPTILVGDSQALPVADETIDLIVTSPPYAANAIDYMRAHKFSLVWLGYPIEALSTRRNMYVGGEATAGWTFAELPDYTEGIIQQVEHQDNKRAQSLRRYYTEMNLILSEMHRVLRPGRAAIVVVGSSIMRGVDTETHTCLAEIGESLGFSVPGIGVRHLDRDRRMMPTAARRSKTSSIDARMNEEYVIGYYKHDQSSS